MIGAKRIARAMVVLLAAVLVLDSTPVSAQRSGEGVGGAATAPMSGEARAFLEAALDTLQRLSMHRDTVDWQVIRDSARLLAAGASLETDTYAAIHWALKRVDRHSFLAAPYGGHRPRVIDGVGYLRIPQYNGPGNAPLADSLQLSLAEMDAAGVCGWIVDLRANRGGNVWPMLSGIGPLIGDSVVSGVRQEGMPWSHYADGVASYVDEAGERQVLSRISVPAHTMRRPDAPVAVLLGANTASSGESIAIAFATRPNTRSFGQPTARYASVNRNARLPNGTEMYVTVGMMRDRNGLVYAEGVAPDVVLPGPSSEWPSPTDEVARAARQWLLTQPACAAPRD